MIVYRIGERIDYTMKITISNSYLSIVKPSEDQLQTIEKACGNAEIKHVANGIIVNGKPEELYKTLVKLSFNYDLELV